MVECYYAYYIINIFQLPFTNYPNKVQDPEFTSGLISYSDMDQHLKSTPKDVFLHLFNIITFYLSVIGFIIMYVQYINATFPDALNYYFTGIANLVRTSTSMLFISVPAYIFTSWLLAKDLNTAPEKRELKLRKWLVYFTLFISAITIIVDLMIFVYNFLDGELDTRFFLKVLVVLLVAGAVFGYYMWDIKRIEIKSKVPKILAIILGVVVLGSIILGFFVVGTPKDQRNRRFDESRTQDLQSLQEQVIYYWQRKKTLPPTLDNLSDDIIGYVVPTDPDSKQSYEYTIVDPLKFELCAVFSIKSDDYGISDKDMMYTSPYDATQQNWKHEAGRECFTRTIDPELYKFNQDGMPVGVPIGKSLN